MPAEILDDALSSVKLHIIVENEALSVGIRSYVFKASPTF